MIIVFLVLSKQCIQLNDDVQRVLCAYYCIKKTCAYSEWNVANIKRNPFSDEIILPTYLHFWWETYQWSKNLINKIDCRFLIHVASN